MNQRFLLFKLYLRYACIYLQIYLLPQDRSLSLNEKARKCASSLFCYRVTLKRKEFWLRSEHTHFRLSGTFVRLGEAGPMTGSAFVLLRLLFANLHRDAIRIARSEILIPT